MRILILGHTGMLGYMTHKYLKSNSLNVETTEHRWPSREFKEFIKDYNGDFVINCIGAIHQKTKNFDINYELPIFLNIYSKCRIIHPGTDCEIDNDDYGTSKRVASDYIKESGKNTKIIKTSIIGPELRTSYSLMNWFLNNQEGSEVKGFTNHMWNGNTTLTWAQYCLSMVSQWDSFETETVIASECVSKYELLLAIKDVYEKNVIVRKDDRPGPNKCLIGQINTKHIKEQLKDLKKYVG